jgi:formylglycine-generating enzyme required for sulfatase activity
VSAEREFLAWRSGLESARRVWQATPEADKHDALLLGGALPKAQSWLAKRAEDLLQLDRDFITQSIARDRKAQARARRLRRLVYVLLVGMIAGLIGWINQSYIKDEWRWYATERPFMQAKVRPFVKTEEAERVLKPGDTFRECVSELEKDYCPEMVVVPPGRFMMGSPDDEKGRSDDESPLHPVTIAKQFAVSKFELTFDEWDTCRDYGDCEDVSDDEYGRGRQPVINTTWNHAQSYVAWLSRMTGKAYRLLSEAEYEYAARAGTQSVYPWGDDIGVNKANCAGCGSPWDNKQPASVGSFDKNQFGLYDMVGNVWEWVEDCYQKGYKRAREDGSALTEMANCRLRRVRSAYFQSSPVALRAAQRSELTPNFKSRGLGFRVARTLVAP